MKQRRKDPRKRITGITKSDEEQRQERRTCKGGTRRREKMKDKSNQVTKTNTLVDAPAEFSLMVVMFSNY